MSKTSDGCIGRRASLKSELEVKQKTLTAWKIKPNKKQNKEIATELNKMSFQVK